MKLYDSTQAPNPRRVRIFLAEKGIEVATVQVDIGRGESREAAFLTKNPLGRVPVLELDDGSCIAETIAICRYFEDLQPEPPLFGREARERAEVEMWQRRVEFEVWGLIMSCFQNTHEYFKSRGPQVPEYGELCRERALARLAWMDEVLADREFVAGVAYTVADITLLCAIDFARVVRMRIRPDQRNLARWHEGVSGRSSAKA